ncbi:MAG: helix-turn-helix transcriptional regulator, partial [Clostridia bacterium]|nr:helix-turn-helix transcriptional regulator [Clostridia bacterium]
ISVDQFFYPDMSADDACKKRINTLAALTLDRFGYWCYTLNIIKEIVHMRQYNNLSQNELADISGVRQPMIARIEHGINTPNMSTVLKLLAAFGKTLYIGDLKNVELEDGADSVAADEDLTTE